MKKFEEELFSEVPCKFGLSTEGEYKQSILVKHFGDWVSPEDHQFKVGEVQDDLSCANEEIERLNAKLEKQQPEIPEVPQFVEEYAQDCERELSYLLEEIYLDTDYLEDHSTRNEREGLIARYWLYNRTVAKEKRFYLKNKLTGQRLIRLLEENGGGFLECVTSIDKERMQFTQSEIDSMAAESYEQIEVEE